MIAIQLSSVSLYYPKRPKLLIDLHLEVPVGQWVCLLGRSGCGKSTLLKVIAGINHGAVQHGTISLHTPTSDVSSAPARVAYMAQQDALLPWLSLLDNVQLPQRLTDTHSAQSAQQARTLLSQVGLSDHLNKKPYQISGGQRQRVALARTLMTAADIVLMDEPFSALDAITRLELQQLAVTLLQGKTVMLITHDPIEAIRLADCIYVLRAQNLTAPFYPEGERPRFDPELAQPQLQRRLLEALK